MRGADRIGRARGGSRRQLGEERLHRRRKRGDGVPEASQRLSHVGELVLPGDGDLGRRTATVQYRQPVGGLRDRGVESGAGRGCVRAPGLDDQLLERLLLAHRALDEHVELGQERERLGDVHGIAPGERTVPHRAHTAPGHPALVAVVRLGHHQVGPARRALDAVEPEAVQHGAAAAGRVARHAGLAGRDAQVAVPRGLLGDGRLQQRARPLRVDEHGERREVVVGGLDLDGHAEPRQPAAPAGRAERHGRRSGVGLYMPRRHQRAEQAQRPLAAVGIGERHAVPDRPPVLLEPGLSRIDGGDPEPPLAELGHRCDEGIRDPNRVGGGDQPVGQLPQRAEHVDDRQLVNPRHRRHPPRRERYAAVLSLGNPTVVAVVDPVSTA